MSREIYGEIDKYILDHAAERGTSVHKATEDIDKLGSCEIESLYIGYVQAYAAFLKEHEVTWALTEKPLADRQAGYAGTIDRFGTLDGKTCILDFKTNGVIKKPLVKSQLNAYNGLLIANGFQPSEKLWCLQLCHDGKYRLYDVAFGMEEFNSCLIIHKALKKKHGRMKID
jgi:hypothetical protein